MTGPERLPRPLAKQRPSVLKIGFIGGGITPCRTSLYNKTDREKGSSKKWLNFKGQGGIGPIDTQKTVRLVLE